MSFQREVPEFSEMIFRIEKAAGWKHLENTATVTASERPVNRYGLLRERLE